MSQLQATVHAPSWCQSCNTTHVLVGVACFVAVFDCGLSLLHSDILNYFTAAVGAKINKDKL